MSDINRKTFPVLPGVTTATPGSVHVVGTALVTKPGARTTASHTTASLAAGASETFTLSLGRLGVVFALQASALCRVRFYPTAALRTADSARALATPPAPGAGVLADLNVTALAAPYHVCGPMVLVNNGDSPTVPAVYMVVENTDSVAAVIVLIVTYMVLEHM